MKKNYVAVAAVFFCFLILPDLAAQGDVPAGNDALQSGPMLGYVDMMEALVWVQTKSDALVSVEYWDTLQATVKYRTEPVTTYKQLGYTAKCIADRVKPGKTYAYTVFINNKAVVLPYPTRFSTQALWQWRSDPPAFSVAAGSCAYVNETEFDRPGRSYGSDYPIFLSIAQQDPDLMLWLGDNTYLREPDWNTRTGMLHRYTYNRSLPELQPLLAAAHHYAIWDDHDFGPDDSDASWIHKDMAHEVFQGFWGNPSAGLPGKKGCTTKFQYNDIDFFLLDNRYNRTPNYCKTCPRTQLGQEQLDWFIGALAASRAPFKIVAVGGQLLTTSLNGETFSHLFPAERDTILARIEREGIRNVIFLTGDKHYTEFSGLKNKAGNWVYDLTASSLTAGVFADAANKEINQHRIEGTLVAQHNFAMLRFSGPRTKRELRISIQDVGGKELWTKTIGTDGVVKP
jgi:alkaline phosphatase D